MQVKDRVLEALEGHRGTYFSGEALAKELQVSRNAVWKAIRQLRDQGYPIHAVSNRGYSLAPDSAMLSPQSIAPFLTVPGLQVEVQPVVTSTNQVLRQRAEEGAHEGLALVAVTQTAGRGRRDHSFFSPPDSGLYLSFLLRPDLSARDALSLTTCAAASVALAIEECLGFRDRRPAVRHCGHWGEPLPPEGGLPSGAAGGRRGFPHPSSGAGGAQPAGRVHSQPLLLFLSPPKR